MITLELAQDESSDRNVFNNFLKKCGWTKIESISTTWIYEFYSSDSRQCAIIQIHDRIKQGVKAGNFKDYKYAVQMSESPLIIENEPGEYVNEEIFNASKD